MKSVAVLLLTAGLVSAVAVPVQLAERDSTELQPLTVDATAVRRAEWYVRAETPDQAVNADGEGEELEGAPPAGAQGDANIAENKQNNQNVDN
ncbi:Uncharacterized protein TPAR_02487, partial [Tolypocladium paradoxum]